MKTTRQRLPRFDAVGWVVVILALGVAGALFSLVWDDAAGVSDSGASLLQPVFTGLIGVLGAYVGVTKGNNDQQRNGPPPPPSDDDTAPPIPWPPPTPPRHADKKATPEK